MPPTWQHLLARALRCGSFHSQNRVLFRRYTHPAHLRPVPATDGISFTVSEPRCNNGVALRREEPITPQSGPDTTPRRSVLWVGKVLAFLCQYRETTPKNLPRNGGHAGIPPSTTGLSLRSGWFRQQCDRCARDLPFGHKVSLCSFALPCASATAQRKWDPTETMEFRRFHKVISQSTQRCGMGIR